MKRRQKDFEPSDVFVSESFAKKAVLRFFRHKLAVVGLGLIVLITLLSIFYPMIGKQSLAFDLNFMAINKPPVKDHIMGTDALGRDVFMRLMLGGRVSLTVGFFAAIISTLIGVTLGGIAGFFGGKTDNLIMRFTDTMMCFPFLVICMVLVSILGSGLEYDDRHRAAQMDERRPHHQRRNSLSEGKAVHRGGQSAWHQQV